MMNTTKCNCGEEIQGTSKREMYHRLFEHKFICDAPKTMDVETRNQVLMMSQALELQ